MAHDPLDNRLETPAQHAVRDLVGGLPGDTPNMAWRAALSDRIAQEGKRTHRRRWFLHIGRPLGGLALTASLAFAVLLRGGTVSQRAVTVASSRTIEATLVRAHRESDAAFDVSGSGMAADSYEGTPAAYEGWDESDVEAF